MSAARGVLCALCDMTGLIARQGKDAQSQSTGSSRFVAAVINYLALVKTAGSVSFVNSIKDTAVSKQMHEQMQERENGMAGRALERLFADESCISRSVHHQRVAWEIQVACVCYTSVTRDIR
jgi:selenocysteine lyase/cysteine desulfurase